LITALFASTSIKCLPIIAVSLFTSAAQAENRFVRFVTSFLFLYLFNRLPLKMVGPPYGSIHDHRWAGLERKAGNEFSLPFRAGDPTLYSGVGPRLQRDTKTHGSLSFPYSLVNRSISSFTSML